MRETERPGAQAARQRAELAIDLSWLTSAPARLGSGFERSLQLGALSEVFLVTAVASLLLIRGFLALTGFPQVGGGGLHIAHMLWGGLLMLASLLLLLGFIGRRVLFLAAFLSGAGFGTFIDELGKFITSDNDYFFQPAIGAVYVIFVLVFLVSRGLEARRRYSDAELLANTFEVVRESVLRKRRPARCGPVLAYLRDHAGEDPVLLACLDRLERTPPGPSSVPAPLRALRRAAIRLYLALVDSRGLDRVVTAVFLAYVAFVVLTVGVAVAAYLAGPPRSPFAKGGIAFTGIFLSNGLSAALIAVAAVRLRASRLAALRWFDRAVLVDLLLGQVFAFYLLQFGALFGVALDLVVLLILKGAIRTQGNLERHHRAVQ